MIRVALLANFYSETSGGLRVVVDRLADGYREDGRSVTLITPAATSRTTAGRIEIAAPRIANGSGYRVITSGRAVQRALEFVAPDVIEVHDKLLLPWAWHWAQRRGAAVIAVSHERLDATLAQFVPRAPERLRAAIAEAVARRVVERSDRVVTYSAFAAAEYGDAPGLRLASLGVDLDAFAPDRIAHREGPIRLVCVSRLSAEKRPDIAVATLAELLGRGLDATLTVFGSGLWEARLRRQSAGLPVHFGGFAERPTVARALAAADIAIFPGPAETFCLAALEALACATPIVVVAGSGAAELVAGRASAGRAARLSATAFADAATHLLRIPVAVRRSSARGAARERTWERTVAAMLAVHSELLGSLAHSAE